MHTKKLLIIFGRIQIFQFKGNSFFARIEYGDNKNELSNTKKMFLNILNWKKICKEVVNIKLFSYHAEQNQTYHSFF